MNHGRDMLKPIVMDNGSCTTKVGFAGDDVPFSKFFSIIGRYRTTGVFPELKRLPELIGDEAHNKRDICNITYPIKSGIISNWDHMEKIWDHTFKNELSVEPESHPILLTEPPLNPKQNREKMTEIMFESYDVSTFYAIIHAVASLYSTGHTTGIVIESGENVSHTVPIYEGYALSHAISRLDLGGCDIQETILKLLLLSMSWGYTSAGRFCYFKRLKKKYAYVALDFEKELQLEKEDPSSVEEIFDLPDGNTWKISSTRFRCTEILFNPSIAGLESPGIQVKANESIMKCDTDISLSFWENRLSNIRKRLYESIVLSGGSTMIPGFGRRVDKDIGALAPNNMKIRVMEPNINRMYSAWVGGSIFASLDTFQQMWISKADYYEYGSSIVHPKCL